MVSNVFIASVKLSPLRAYQIAWAAGLHPSTLSRIVNGIERVEVGDERVLRVGEILGLDPQQCFEMETACD